MDALIETRKLSKRYPGVKTYALKDLSLQVKSGEIYGFLGANGAGKSTTIRLLMNFLQPTAGSAQILGLDSVKKSVAVKREVGYLAGEVALYNKLTGEQFLHYMNRLQPAKDQAYVKSLVHSLQAELHKPIGELSKGNRQKFGIIQAFMHQPKVLILDEPTSGLDPLMQEVFYDLIAQAKSRGAAVLFSSHDLSEVRKICDRVAFIRDGALIAEQTIADLQRHATHTFVITFQTTAPIKELRNLKQTQVQSVHDTRVSLEVQGDLSPLFKVLSTHGVVAFDRQEVDLEKEFLKLYRRDEA